MNRKGPPVWKLTHFCSTSFLFGGKTDSFYLLLWNEDSIGMRLLLRSLPRSWELHNNRSKLRLLDDNKAVDIVT